VIVLALDTTTAQESVAVVQAQAVLGEVRLAATDSHSRRLVPAIEFLLASLELSAARLDGFAVTAGPGSFTGLRVGLSTVQGLALGANRPCYPASTLDILAARIEGAAPHLVALMDAFRGEVYAARYDGQGALVEGPLVSAPEPWLRSLPPDCAFLGDAVPAQRVLIESACLRPRFPARSLFLAATLGRVAERALLDGKGVAAAALRPLYLREPSIRRAAP